MVLGEETVQAVLADVDRAPTKERCQGVPGDIDDPLRATLAFLRKVTRDHGQVTPDDVRALFALGVTPAQVEEALDVAFAFNVITRLADTFAFELRSRAAADVGAKRLLTHGYGG